jgi:hypothetical protein
MTSAASVAEPRSSSASAGHKRAQAPQPVHFERSMRLMAATRLSRRVSLFDSFRVSPFVSLCTSPRASQGVLLGVVCTPAGQIDAHAPQRVHLFS